MFGWMAADKGELWDMSRPLIGDCQLQLLKFQDDKDAKAVSSSSRSVVYHIDYCF